MVANITVSTGVDEFRIRNWGTVPVNVGVTQSVGAGVVSALRIEVTYVAILSVAVLRVGSTVRIVVAVPAIILGKKGQIWT